ncbi:MULTISPECIES: heavy metal translocating P-type ATPase [unclassified Wenzhouxiangella]|uniref:heavy metal translocating P-type ATPase n=1 Tax=unclassified Wenzhouxiangella TaxID=2613841 RepID=UPI0011C02863|nr:MULTISPECIES: heavy metal translocating P-type ATPase [unclassified Wenzhouxiangella]
MSHAASPSCWHCGEPVPAGVDLQATVGGEARPMCCHGCQAVATLIDQAGLDRYYDFRDALPQRPDAAAHPDDYSAWDRDAIGRHYARTDCDGMSQITLVLENIHCAACAWLIKRFVGELEGIAEIQVDIGDGRARLHFDPERAALSEIATRLAALGYRPHLDSPQAGEQRDRAERRRLLKAIVVAGLGMVQVMSYALAGYIGAFQDIDPTSERFFQLVSMIVAVPVAFYSGRVFYASAWRTLRQGRMGMDVPVAAAMLLALTASIVITLLDAGEAYFDSVVMFIFFLLLGRYAVLVTRQRAGSVHSALARSLPAAARRMNTDGMLEPVALVELEPGDRVQVSAGETVPADGRIVSGRAMIDESLLSGESSPRRRGEEESVLAGSMLRDGQLVIEVGEIGQSTVLAGIVQMLEQARDHKPRLAQVADRIAGVFVAFVLTGAAVTALAWWQIDPGRILPVVIAVLVVSCPCALALGTPVALASAGRGFARLGILTTGSDVLEKLPKITHVVLDKTGTLTQPDMSVAEIAVEDRELGQAAILRLAGRLERVSRHPVASAFEGHDDGGEVEQAEAVMAAGVRGSIDGRDLALGKPAWIAERLGREITPPGPGQWIALADADRLLAWLRLDSPLREGARELVEQLKARNIKVMLASGDRSENVAQMASRLDIDHFEGDLKPADKLERVRQLQAEGARVAMVGDGINDAPVLAGADVSLALAEGADIARTQADLVITGRGLDRVSHAFELAPRVVGVVHQNLAWAFAYNLVALPLAATGFIPPWAAAIGMSISSLLVVANGRRAGKLPRQVAPLRETRRESGPTSPVAEV